MGRFTAYDQDGHMVSDFDKSEYDFIRRYGSTPEEVLYENAKLRELVSGLEHCCQGFACDCCPLYDPSGTNHRRCEILERELGIEV